MESERTKLAKKLADACVELFLAQNLFEIKGRDLFSDEHRRLKLAEIEYYQNLEEYSKAIYVDLSNESLLEEIAKKQAKDALEAYDRLGYDLSLLKRK